MNSVGIMPEPTTVDMPKIEDSVYEKSHSSNGDTVLNVPPPADTESNGESATATPPTEMETVENAEKPPVTRAQLAVILIGSLLCIFMGSLDQTIVTTALPQMGEDFNEPNQTTWVVIAYLLTSTAVSPLYGRLADAFGRKRMLIFALLVFMVASLICGLSTLTVLRAQSMTMLIVFRALQGVGGGGLLSLIMILIADVTTPKQRPGYQAMVTLAFAVASIIGPLLGGVITDTIGWPWIFYINLPIGAICITVIAVFTKFSPLELEIVKGLDFLGAGTSVVAVILILLPTLWGGVDYAWSDGIIIGLYCAGGVCVVAFVCIELFQANEPIIPFRAFSDRNLTFAAIISFGIGYSFISTLVYIPLFFQHGWGETPTQSGVDLLPFLAAMIGSSIASGGIVSKIGIINPFLIFGTAVIPLGLGLLSLLHADTTMGEASGIMITTGLGIGAAFATVFTVGQVSAKPKYVAAVTASLMFFLNLGGVVGAAVFQSVLTTEMAKQDMSNPVQAFVNAIDKAFLYNLIVPALAFPPALFLKWKRLSSEMAVNMAV